MDGPQYKQNELQTLIIDKPDNGWNNSNNIGLIHTSNKTDNKYISSDDTVLVFKKIVHNDVVKPLECNKLIFA